MPHDPTTCSQKLSNRGGIVGEKEYPGDIPCNAKMNAPIMMMALLFLFMEIVGLQLTTENTG